MTKRQDMLEGIAEARSILRNARDQEPPSKTEKQQKTKTTAQAWEQARTIDPLNYLWGLKQLTFVADKDKWHSRYIPDTDTIEVEQKFQDKDYTDKVQTFLHEGGHRGQMKDPETFAAFKKLDLDTLPNFLEMANAVHRSDFFKHGIDDLAEEAFAESYARFALGLEMPPELRDFWQTRVA
jgi:hypothetical protein